MAVLQNLWIRGGKQRLGGVVLYQMNGQTLARELAPQVANPRTTAQMRQRVKLSNLVAFYKANKVWMRNAFEDKAQRESDYNAFVAANIGNTLVALTKSEVASGAAVAAPYQVTRGSILSIEHTLQGSTIKTNLNLGNFQIAAGTTIGQLSTAILNNNLTLSEGMQLSLIVNVQQSGNASQQPYIVVRVYEFLLSRTSTEPLTNYFPESVTSVAAGTNNYALALNTTTYAEGGATFILSHSVGGVTRVSSQRLQLFGSQTVYNAHTTAAAMQAAIDSYGVGGDVFLDSNNANALLDVLNTMTILSVKIGNNTYMAGDTIPGIDQGDELTFNMSQQIPAGAEVSAIMDIQGGAGEVGLDHTTAQGNKVTAQNTTSSYDSNDGNPVVFMVTINGETYSLNCPMGSGQHLGD